jgi:hypothetical protein
MPAKNQALNEQLETLVGDANYAQCSMSRPGNFHLDGIFSLEMLEAVIALIKKESHASEESTKEEPTGCDA